MISSTSSSEKERGKGFVGTFIAVFLGFGLILAALLVLLDPYDTARLTPFPKAGMPETGPRVAHASRMRNPEFNAAIFGNSTIQILSPERLNAATGLRFVQLSVPGTGPMEQAAMIEHLVRQRGNGIGTIALGLDSSWCDASRSKRTLHPFPFWLYDSNPLTYLASLVRMDSLEFLPKRIRMLLGKGPFARPDGFWDYEAPGGYKQYPLVDLKLPAIPAPVDGRRAAADTLARIVKSLPAETRLLLLHPPLFAPTPPQSTDDDTSNLSACKAELASTVAGRPRTEIIDLWIDNPENRIRTMFYDHNHYTRAMAMRVEAAISDILRRAGRQRNGALAPLLLPRGEENGLNLTGSNNFEGR
jgi:hypothetical protein